MKLENLGNNTVKVTKTKKIKDTEGKDVYIYAEPVEYGLNKINAEIDAIQAEKDFWSVPENVTARLAELQEQLDERNLIKQELIN